MIQRWAKDCYCGLRSYPRNCHCGLRSYPRNCHCELRSYPKNCHCEPAERAWQSHHRGYTLIEVLVVLLIISIVTSVALLTISRNETQQIESFAREITQVLSLAEEQAMLQPAVLGLMVNENKLNFASLKAAKDSKKNVWEPLADSLLGAHAIPHNLEVKIVLESMQATSDTNPQIVISTNGDITPFTIYVGKKGKMPQYIIQGDAGGNITHHFLS